ncbi:MAG: Ig domain-containing protein [Lawsonella sp.]
MVNTAFITSSGSAPEGVLHVAPVGTVLPTSALDDLDAGFQDLGTISDAGVVQNIERDIEPVYRYDGTRVYDLQTNYDHNFNIEVLESVNAVTLKGIFGDDHVDDSDPNNIVVKHNRAKLPRVSVILDHLIDQGLRRQVIEVAQITLNGEVNHTHQDVIRYSLSITAFPGSDGNNVIEYISTMDGAGAGTTDLQVATSVLKAGTVGVEYSANVLATGGKEPYNFSVASGELPAGLTLASNGAISGTPTAEGDSTITVQVSDAAGNSATKSLSISVAAA